MAPRVKAANPGMQPDVGGKTKPKSQGKMDAGTRADLQYRKANLKKSNEETELVDVYEETCPICGCDPCQCLEGNIEESVRIPAQTGNVYAVIFSWRAKMYMLKLFFPEIRKPKRSEVEDAIRKLYPGATLRSFNLTPYQPGDSYLHAGMDEDMEEDSLGKIEEGTPAWQRKAGKDPSGGLNQKGVDSYRRANPGSKLQTAVTTKPSKLKKGSKAAKRRKSFCARMKGMKKRLTSAKTARDPDSRINKSLRKWNC